MSCQTSHQLLSSALDISCLSTGNHEVTPRFGARKLQATELLHISGYVIWPLITPRKHNMAFNKLGKEPSFSKWCILESLPSFSYHQKELKYITKALWQPLCGDCKQCYSVCFKFGAWGWFSFSNYYYFKNQATIPHRLKKPKKFYFSDKIFCIVDINSYTHTYVWMKYVCTYMYDYCSTLNQVLYLLYVVFLFFSELT